MQRGNAYNNLNKITGYWDPHVIASLNGQMVKIARIKGEFTWHAHKDEEEMFFILKGQLTIHFRNSVERLSEGDYLVIPKGKEHKPVAEEECWIMLFEPESTLNTGNEINDFTKKHLKNI